MIFPRVRLFAQGALSTTLAALLLAAPVSDAKPSRETRQVAGGEFDALPLTRSRQNHLLVRAYINGKPARLIVDTGAPSIVISSKRRAYFGLTRAPANLNWPRKVQVNGALSNLLVARSLGLGKLNVVDVPVVLADMSSARNAYRVTGEQQVDGLLGADVLFATKAILDCREATLILSLYPDVSSHPPGLDYRGFQRMPMYVTEGLNSYVDGSVNGTPARLMVDTGAFATLLHRPFVRHLRVPLHATDWQSARLNLADDNVDIARIKKLSVGMVDIIGKRVGVTDLAGFIDSDSTNSPPVVGLLGGEILNRHHGVIDFGTRTLYLKRESASVVARERAAQRSRVPQTKPVFPD